MRLFRRFSDVGVTVLVATHDQHIVRDLAKREIVLASGEVQGDGADALPHVVASR
jgi:ABC-type ATPase involved in cell division